MGNEDDVIEVLEIPPASDSEVSPAHDKIKLQKEMILDSDDDDTVKLFFNLYKLY